MALALILLNKGEKINLCEMKKAALILLFIKIAFYTQGQNQEALVTMEKALTETCQNAVENPKEIGKIDSIQSLILIKLDSVELKEFQTNLELFNAYIDNQRRIFRNTKMSYNEQVALTKLELKNRIVFLEYYYTYIVHKGWH